MADYKELLRRAVEALPENNGAARRAVYEKARAALVGQLRAINPPLPARDITTHRLQLEDCIRQVEQEASEANIAGITQQEAPLALPPVFAAEAKIRPQPKSDSAPRALAKPQAEPKAESTTAKPKAPVRAAAETVKPARPELRLEAKPIKAEPKNKVSNSIEEIIAAAERDRESAPPVPRPKGPEFKTRPVLVAKSPAPAREQIRIEPQRAPNESQRHAASHNGDARMLPAPSSNEGRMLPAIVARAEAAKGRPIAASANFGASVDGGVRRGPVIEPRRERSNGIAATARQVDPIEFDVPEDLAMTAVREVEVEQQSADPQGAIDRAIATLDREARGDEDYSYSEPEFDDEPMIAPRKNGANGNGRGSNSVPQLRAEREGLPQLRAERESNAPRAPRPAKEFANPRRSSRLADTGMPKAREERGGMGAVSIFLIIFAALLIGAGGAGFWAWQEGFVNLDAMFGRGTPAVATAAAADPVTPDSTGPGNTTTVAAQPSIELKADERLPAADTQVAAVPPPTSTAPLALQAQAPAAEAKIEERLGSDTAVEPNTASEAVAAVDPASVAGSQSLLLEASDDANSGAVPFSGTASWSRGTDETGEPTLIGKANIPARNLSVEVLIRKNTDPSLPASHLMEINFTVSDSFVGGSIAGLPGVLLKNEELVQGAPLVGASARVVGNSFLFALSAEPADNTANVNLLTTRKWLDLALIYASGKRAIITFEKDDAAQQLFADVFNAWSQAG